MAEASPQIEQDLGFLKREWILERIAWTVMLVVIVCAAAGLFGYGMLSHISVHGEDLRLDYERFIHSSTPTSLIIRARATSRDEIEIKLTNDFLHAVKIEQIAPEPERTEVGDKWLTYHFRASAPGEATIRIDFTPEAVGRLTGAIRSRSGALLSFRQFVYP